nr:ATP-dependent DNA helicase [Bacilli bacterium]
KMSKCVYKSAEDGGLFFLEAPTGIGKTISSIYPAYKAIGNGKIDRIFYLTAKSSGRLAAENAASLLLDKGLKSRVSSLTAKDKMCLSLGSQCNPEECPFAKDYYGKLRMVYQKELPNLGLINREEILSIAHHYAMCPFELQLDLSLYSDLIICDYNYLFDPLVYLERFFGEESDPSKSLALIDEAHNLPERARNMYSSSLSVFEALKAKKALVHVKERKMKKSLKTFIEEVKSYDEELLNGIYRLEDIPSTIFGALSSFDEAHSDNALKNKIPYDPDLNSFSREVYRFLKILDGYKDSTILYIEKKKDDYLLQLYCPDASKMVLERLSALKGASIFSATLSPISFFQEEIIGHDEEPYLLLPSPFPKENFKLLVSPTSTRYKDRQMTLEQVARSLEEFVNSKLGNYFLFMPSYEYLEMIKPILKFKDAQVYIQEKGMNDDEKNLLLSRFLPNPDHTSVGLLIIGGSFAEGVDLLLDRLIGVAVVGIGLPTISYDKEIIKDYYQEKNGKGYEYSYMNPGMNKVMQAVGRLIRSEEDVGAALLIDDRYLRYNYQSILKRAWKNYSIVREEGEIERILKSFYSDKA